MMWFVAVFFSTLGILRWRFEGKLPYVLGFGLAPAIAKTTGSLLPISIGAVLPSPWGLIANCLMWAGIGWLLSQPLKSMDRGLPAPYFAAGAWGVLFAFNWKAALLVLNILTIMMVIFILLVGMKLDFQNKLKEPNFASIDPIERLMPLLLKWGLIMFLLLILIYLESESTVPGLTKTPPLSYWNIIRGFWIAVIFYICCIVLAPHVKIFEGYIWRSANKDSGP
jgi:hypothetical protein